MKVETLTDRNDMLIHRATLKPGEATQWHTDACHRFSVVVHGSRLAIEYADNGETEEFDAPTGEADWNEPEPRLHRAINIGESIFEEVVTFYRADQSVEPQPTSQN